MTTVNVWPRLGTTVTLESGYVVTAAGAATLLTDEIAGLLRARRLQTSDPTEANPNPSPIPASGEGGLVAASATSLNELEVSTDGVVCNLTEPGKAGVFVWDIASTDTVDSALCCGNAARAGRWFRQRNAGYVHVDWFGAVGDGVTDDAAAIQAAIAAGKVVEFGDKTYGVRSPIIFGARATYRGAGEKATTIKALQAMPYVARLEGEDATLEGLSFHANGLAIDALGMYGCNGSTLTGCNFQNARRNGVESGYSNNNNVSFYKCNSRFNGTTLTSGTVTTVAGSQNLTFSVAKDLAALERSPYISIPTVAPEGRDAGDPFIVEYWVSPTVARCTFPAASSATTAYTLYSGNGWNEQVQDLTLGLPGGNDNNVWYFDHCYAVGCSKAGWQIDVLYGPQMNLCNTDATYIGVKIGIRAPTFNVAPQGTNILRGYFEGCAYDILIESNDGTVITDPIASSTRVIWAPDSIGYQSCVLTHRGRVASEGRVSELVNAVTVPAPLGSEHVVFVSSPAAADIVQMLPDNGNDVAGTDTFTKMLTFVSADIGGKTITFKTASGSTLVNGVAGTTGITVSGNYKRWTATWCENLNGWVVV